MRGLFTLALLGLSTLGSGCALVDDASRNAVVAIKTPIEAHKENARNQRWAEAAWTQVCASSGDGGLSCDHAQGFKDGYAEYLFRGGDGEPPLMPPLAYRHILYQNQQGYQAIQDWFNGYRHGAAVARDSGARRWITGPSSMASETQVPDSLPFVLSQPEEIHLEPNSLPVPRVVPAPKREEHSQAPASSEIDRTRFGPIEMISAAAEEGPPALDEMKAKISGIRAIPPPSDPSEAATLPAATDSAPSLPVRARITGINAPPTPDQLRAKILGIKTAPN